MPANTNTRKPTKTQQIFSQLHDDIVNNIFVPGERLPISKLKERYQVGGSPLRESLSRLATQGLLEIEPQCGFRVKPLSLAELHDIYMAREVIDTHALELALQMSDDAWEADVIAKSHRLIKYIDPRTQIGKIETAEWEKRQQDFYFAIIKGSQSPWLIKIHHMLYAQATRYRRLCLQKHHRDKKLLTAVVDEYQRLVKAILARDIPAARKIFQQSWRTTVQTISVILKKSLKE